jgi:hypothetical protein
MTLMLAGWVRDIAEIIPGALHGGGGSAGDAQHLAGEMLSRHYYDRAPCVDDRQLGADRNRQRLWIRPGLRRANPQPRLSRLQADRDL